MASSSSSSVIEEAHPSKIRVFNWNEKLRKDYHLQFVDQGLFLLVIKSDFNNGRVEISKGLTERVNSFQLASLLSSDDIKSMVIHILSSSAQFLPNTIPPLALEISDYLTRSFLFQRDTLITPSNSPITVVVTEISRTMTVENADDTASSLFPPQWIYPSAPDDDLRNMDVDYDIDEGDNDPSWDYDDDFIHIVWTLRNSMGVHDIFPVKPIAVDQPFGLVQVLPETALQILHPLEDDGLLKMLDDCPICLKDFSLSAVADVILKTPCSHIFHDKCIRQWLSKSHSCPMCRFVIV